MSFDSPRARRITRATGGARKLPTSPTELTLKSHTGRWASTPAWLRTNTEAPGSQRRLWTALPRTTAEAGYSTMPERSSIACTAVVSPEPTSR